jgi:mannose-1-phosphate guanylyltransferase
MKAAILAAGKGTRVRPLTQIVPKPMIPLLGRPVMELLVDHLRTHGFDQIVVNTSYLAPQIEEYFRDGRRFGVDMAYSFECSLEADGLHDTPQGSAGGLRRIQDLWGFFDHTFAVLCGDAIVDVDLTQALHAHRAHHAIATIVTTPVERHQVSSYGIVVADADGRVQSFQEKPSVEAARSTCANSGVYIFEPEIFDYIPIGEVFDIGSQLFPALLAAKAPLYAVDLPFQWVDIGTTPDYWHASMMLLQGQIHGVRVPGRELAPGIFVGLNVALPSTLHQISPPVWIGGSARLAEGARILGPAAIGAGSVVEPGALIERSVVWDHTRVTRFAELRDSIVSVGYCIRRDGTMLSLDAAQLDWVLDDVRKAPKPMNVEFGSMMRGLHWGW